MKTDKDLILVERKVFLDLISAAQLAQAFLANRTHASDKFALNTRKALYEALPPAIATNPFLDTPTLA